MVLEEEEYEDHHEELHCIVHLWTLICECIQPPGGVEERRAEGRTAPLMESNVNR